MSEMIERIARALYEKMNPESEEFRGFAEFYRWDGRHFKGQEHYRRMARIVIEEMREPTQPMLDAVDISVPTLGMIITPWRQMIDAALTSPNIASPSQSSPHSTHKP